MFRTIQTTNYFFLIISIVVSLIWGFLGVFVYFILGTILLIYAATKGKGITKYIKNEYPEIYKRRKMINRMTLECNFAVNLFALTEFEINSFADKEIINYVNGIRGLIRSIIISFICILFITVCKYYLKW
jgi:hypothetical protein